MIRYKKLFKESLTSLEQEVYNFLDDDPDGQGTLFFELVDNLKISSKQLRGVLSSLSKKGMVEIEGNLHTNLDDTAIWRVF